MEVWRKVSRRSLQSKVGGGEVFRDYKKFWKKRVKAQGIEKKVGNNCKKIIKNQKRLWYNGVIEEGLYI